MRILFTPLILSLGLLILLGFQGASAGQLVILESTAPGFKPGQIIDSTKSLNIGAGLHLSVIGGNGVVRSIQGPFSGLPGGGGKSADPSLVGALSKLIGAQKSESMALGVTRAMETTRPPIWAIDVLSTGDHCVLAGSPPILWRHRSRKPAKLAIRNLTDMFKLTVPWPAGAAQIPWPADMPLTDGVEYLAKVSTKLSAARLKVHIVPAHLPTDAHRAVWVAERGCRGQARALLARARQER